MCVNESLSFFKWRWYPIAAVLWQAKKGGIYYVSKPEEV